MLLSFIAVSTCRSAPSGSHQGVQNYVYVDGSVNGKPVRLVLDTGAGLDVLTPDAAARVGLKKGIGLDVSTTTDKKVEANLAVVDKWKVGNAVVEKDTVLILKLPKILQADGLVGYGTFKKFVAKFDYRSGSVEFSSPDSFVPPSDSQRIPLTFTQNVPCIDATIDGHSGRVSLDTGANGAISVNQAYAHLSHMTDEHPEKTPQVSGEDAAGQLKGDKVMFHSFQVGPFQLSQLQGVISEEPKKTTLMANVGAEVLRRFDVVFDYPHSSIYLRPNADFGQIQRYNRSGMRIRFDGVNLTVAEVQPGDSSDRAGIRPGDQIIEVDGKAVASSTAKDWESPFSGSPGKAVHLIVRSHGAPERSVTVTLMNWL